MSFIGNSSTNQSFVPQVDYFNGNASNTAFTLSRNVGSVYDIEAVIENVPQSPASAYTVLGNVITFTSAPPSGTNNIYVRYTSPTTQSIKPTQGTVGPTEINSAYSLWNLSGSTINYTAGNVGIGTASPTTKLHVEGQLKVVGSIGTISTDSQGLNLDLNRAGTTGIVNNNASGVLTFGTATSEAMRITSTGFVGVGTTSPYKHLSVTQASSTAYSTTDFDRDYLAVQIANTTDDKATGIYFAVGSNGEAAMSAVETSDGETALTFGTRGSGTRPERMRIPSDGGVRIAMENYGSAPSSTNWGVSINNTGSGSRFFGQGTGTETQIEFGNRNGTRGSIQTNSTNTVYNTTSDYRLKKDVAPMIGALAKIAQLKPSTYKWKVDNSNGQGFIAHELQSVVPDCVSGEKDAVDDDGNPKYQMVDTSFLIATLTAAIQEQQAIIEDLKSRIEVLESK